MAPVSARFFASHDISSIPGIGECFMTSLASMYARDDYSTLEGDTLICLVTFPSENIYDKRNTQPPSRIIIFSYVPWSM